MSDVSKLEFVNSVKSGRYRVKPNLAEAVAVQPEPVVFESELDVYEKRLIQILIDKLEKLER